MVVAQSQRATFADVDALSRAVAARISSTHVEPGGLVGLAAPNGAAFLAGFLALRRATQAVLLLDPLAPVEERRRAISAVGATAVLTCASAWPRSVDDFQFSPIIPSAALASHHATLIPGAGSPLEMRLIEAAGFGLNVEIAGRAEREGPGLGTRLRRRIDIGVLTATAHDVPHRATRDGGQ